MFQNIDLRELAEMSGPERAFVSLYLSGPEALGGLEQRAERVRSILRGNEAELEHFDHSLRMIREALEEHRFEEEGLALFACWALDFLVGYGLTVKPEDRLWVGSSPFIRPLAELQDEYESFLVVAADNRLARIFTVTSAVARERKRVRGDVKQRVKKGGWSQKRYQRRRDGELLGYAKEVSEVLERLEARGAFGRIVLVGAREALREIRDALPERLSEKVVGEELLDFKENGDGELIDAAFRVFFEREREDEAALWDRIREEFLRGGLAAVGPRDVLAAAREGRVDVMLVNREARIAGTRCRACEQLMSARPAACEACGSDDLFEVDLVNELVELLALTSAEAEFSDPLEGLADMGEVAALLRY